MPSELLADRFALERVLGEGGYGVVYSARNVATGQRVAVKVLHPRHVAADDRELARRFEREAERASGLRHPNTVRVFDHGRTDDGARFIVMELLEGEDLGQRLLRAGALPESEAVAVLGCVLRALAEAHEAGLVHRDIKPDNIFLARVGLDADIVKVLDFGLAKLTHGGVSALTQTGVIVGTPAYLSPEQCYGQEVDRRSDLYALGCVAYHMLAGQPPFVAEDTIGYLLQHSQIAPRDVRLAAGPDAAISDGLARWVHRLLKKRPEARFRSAAEALEALEQATRAAAPSWAGPTPTEAAYVPAGMVAVQPPRARRRWPWLAALGGAAGAAALWAATATAPRPVAAVEGAAVSRLGALPPG
ncbi:MAG: serine/threonine protein kinase, partial [Deltaproteobacteria bacterium HGW-Deltaproteobacteria-14]